MGGRISLLACCLTGLVLSSALTGQGPGKPAILPPINPAKARLDQTISGLDGPGFAIAYSPTFDTLVAACEKGTIQEWKKDVLLGIRTGNGPANVLPGHQGPVLALGWNGGPILASAGIDRTIIFWSIAEGGSRKTIKTDAVIQALAMSPDAKILAGGGEDRAIHLWDLDTAKPTGKLAEHADWVTALAYHPQGTGLASGDYKGTVIFWDVAGGKKIRDLTPRPLPAPKPLPDSSPITALGFNPDGKTLAVGEGTGIIHLINVADGKFIRSLPGHTSAVTSLAFHPTGTLLASASKDRTLRLWNPNAPQPLKVLEGHEAWVEGVVFISRGTRLASVGADQTVRIWDLTEPPAKK